MDCIVHGAAELDTTEQLSLHRICGTYFNQPAADPGPRLGLSMVVLFHGSPAKHCEPCLWHGKPLTSHSETHRLCLSAALPPLPGQLVTQPGKDT